MKDEFDYKNEAESPLAEKKKETSGEYLFRVLKPAGCILVLILFILYFVFCFTYKSDPAAAPGNTAQTTVTEATGE